MKPSSRIPVVSVVTPCYNAEPFVAETIESVLAQTHPRVELIVVDDGSSDGSWDVIRSFDDRVTAVQQPNSGVARARNLGAEHATGEFLLFVDADDLLAPDTVEALLSAADGERTIAACGWSRLVRRDDEWTVVPAEMPFPLTHEDPLQAWLRGEWIAGCSLLWPRSLFHEIGGYDETLTADEDGDLMYRALLAGARLAYADGGQSFYRAHGSERVSLSVDVFAEHRVHSRMRVFERVEEELRRQERWEEYREAMGIAYQGLAQRVFAAQPDLAREALRRGEAYAGRRAVAPTLPGRLLVWLLGMERKERLVQGLASLGVMTGRRREMAARGRLPAESGEDRS